MTIIINVLNVIVIFPEFSGGSLQYNVFILYFQTVLCQGTAWPAYVR